MIEFGRFMMRFYSSRIKVHKKLTVMITLVKEVQTRKMTKITFPKNSFKLFSVL